MMKKAKIYFEDKFIAKVEFESISYMENIELRGVYNEIIAIVPRSNLILVEQDTIESFTVNGHELVSILKNTCRNNNL